MSRSVMKSRTSQSTRTRSAKRARPKAKPAGSYHHGELKSALLDAAGGLRQVSYREAADLEPVVGKLMADAS